MAFHLNLHLHFDSFRTNQSAPPQFPRHPLIHINTILVTFFQILPKNGERGGGGESQNDSRVENLSMFLCYMSWRLKKFEFRGLILMVRSPFDA